MLDGGLRLQISACPYATLVAVACDFSRMCRKPKMVLRGVVGTRSAPYGDGVIDVRGVTKRYGEKVAVDDLTFSVIPGVVTGFLGPNGAGKSTTMRLILGLDAPTSGTVKVNGCAYRDLSAPLHVVGAMLELSACFSTRAATVSGSLIV